MDYKLIFVHVQRLSELPVKFELIYTEGLIFNWNLV